MIPMYPIEELSIADVEALIEKGVVFDVYSKTSVLSEHNSDFERESFWGSRDKLPAYIRQSNTE